MLLAVQVGAQERSKDGITEAGPVGAQPVAEDQQETAQGRPIKKRPAGLQTIRQRPELVLKERLQSLKIAHVGAPAINCKFDSDCKITVSDSTDHFILGGTNGDAFLQSRTFPPGQSGTTAEGHTAYLYRLDLTQLTGVTAAPCVNQLSIELGPVVSLDYDDDGSPEQVFVVTSGGLGSVAPSSAIKAGSTITFGFSPPVCSSSAGLDAGETSFFFGLTSAEQPRAVTAQVRDTIGSIIQLAARAPEAAAVQPVQSQSHYASSTTVNNSADWHPSPPTTIEGPEDSMCAGSAAWVVSWIQVGFPAFSIPAGHEVTGIEISVKYQSADSTPAQLTNSGSLVGIVKSVPPVTSSLSNCTSTGWASVGGDGELWGAGLTRASFNAGEFGFRLTQNSGPPITTIDIDAVKLTVYYANP
jgi:hypothetical protein